MLWILKNNIPRDIRKNSVTYLLMGILIAIGMYIASTLSSVTYSTKVVCEANYITSNYQDGQFTIASVADYRVMYTAYMNIDDLRELLGKGKVYNSVYSNEVCDYEPGELLGAYKKMDFIKPAESLEPESKSMSIFLYIIAVFFYMAMITFGVRFSVNAAKRQIAIHSVLGYSYRELKAIFLSSTAVFSAVCGVIGLIAAFIRDFLMVVLIYVLSAGVSLNQIKKLYELDYIRVNE